MLRNRHCQLSWILALGMVLWSAENLFSQSFLHGSVMANYDVLEQHGPGYDLTLIFQRAWGFRYTIIDDLTFLDVAEESNGAIDQIKFQGDLKMSMVIKTIDYQSFDYSASSVFDFLTAYLAVGYSDLDLSLTLDRYQAEGSALRKNTYHHVVHAPSGALSFGLYGGERFLVLDARLMVLKGKTNSTEYLDDRYDIETWMLLLSLGIAY